MPKTFTIITPALNCGKYLLRNLESVRSQGIFEDEIEHWIIDGGSSDNSVDILKRQSDIRFLSEPDRGLSHAVNKGLQRAGGEWIIWLNADDELAPGALQTFWAEKKKFPDALIFAGNQKVFGYDGAVETISIGWDYNLKELLGPRTAIIQASTFVHRRVYQKVGFLDESYRYAMDYQWVVRAMRHYRCQPLPVVLTHYHRRVGSIMDSGIYHQHLEFLRVRREQGQSCWSWPELRIRFYLVTEPLRRITTLRRLVRYVLKFFGYQRLHPIPERTSRPAK